MDIHRTYQFSVVVATAAATAVGAPPPPPWQQGARGTQLERFEWRHTFGKEVDDLIGEPAAGWKLVRLEREAPSSGCVATISAAAAAGEGGVAVSGSGTGGRQTGDGKEVVAFWASGKATRKEAMKLRFLNTGGTGEFGDTFALAAVVSAMGMWDHVRRERQKNPDHGDHGLVCR